MRLRLKSQPLFACTTFELHKLQIPSSTFHVSKGSRALSYPPNIVMNNFPISVKLMASERHKLVVLKLFWAVTHIQKRLFLNCLPFISENPISHKLKVVKGSSTFNASVERVGYVFETDSQNCVDILRSKLTLNEESSDKSINSQSALVDMPVRTTSACCEKPDRNSDSQVISN
ncbi:hypothetical protein T12_11455 [Trichinella patagoniensis]|uniref:Uncharacterized protein n=1 Tax=Trichinella patagoniensis TaxID=990121 RepID=A0A0V1A702_9BILA|nr:hypothetical protein T12_11455 [Trichinella patagoniensis]